MDFVLGVDGGNTKTIALVARLDGTIVGHGRSGCTDIYAAGSVEAALAEMDIAVGAALRSSGASVSRLAAAAFSLAGADWPEDFTDIRAALARRGVQRSVVIVNDAIGALRAGSPDGTGVSVVCGTGAAVGARAPDGRLWHNSWWQEPQGAHELGHRTLWAVYRSELGIEPPTSLTARVLDFFGLDTVEQVLHRMTARGRPPVPNVALLAPVLLDEAAAGDAVARAVVVRHGEALGDFALAAARRVGLQRGPFTLVMAGGVLRHPSRVLTDALVARVRSEAPGARPVFSRLEPAAGALLLALDEAGADTGEATLDRLAATAPPNTLFATLP